MRKVLFLSLLVVALTGLANADMFMYTFSWSGGVQGNITLTSTSLLGNGIGIDKLEVLDVTNPAIDNVYTISSGSFNFDTTAGTFSITGNAGAFGNGTLISGTVTGFTKTGCGVIDFSCDVNLTDGTSNLGSFSTAMGDGGFADAPTGGAGLWLVNSAGFVTTLTTTPEPASLTLLASGLALIGGSLRRKLIK